MAIPFYNQGDQEIYESGNKFIPQEQYRLGYTAPPSIANASTGITNTQAASPYIWPPQGGGGGGGGFSNTNKFGLNLDTMKTISQPKYVEQGGPANMYGGDYVETDRRIAQDEHGNWKDVDTNKNVYHGNINIKTPMTMIMDKLSGKKTTDDPYAGSWYGSDWSDEDEDAGLYSRATGPKNIIQRWKAKKAEEAAASKAGKDAADAAATGEGTNIGGGWTQTNTGGGGATFTGSGGQTHQGWSNTPEGFAAAAASEASFARGGRIGFKDGLSAYQLFKLKELGYPGAGSNPGSYGGLGVLRDILKLHKYKDGGRIGLYAGGDPEEPAENIFEVMQDQNIPFSEQVEGEEGILEQLIAKYIEAGFPPDQAEEMAMQEFEQMAAGSEQGIASLV